MSSCRQWVTSIRSDDAESWLFKVWKGGGDIFTGWSKGIIFLFFFLPCLVLQCKEKCSFLEKMKIEAITARGNVLSSKSSYDCHHMTPTTASPNKAYSICDQRDIPLTALRQRALICPVNAAESSHTVRGEMGPSCAHPPPPAFPVVSVPCVLSGVLLTALLISVMWSLLAHHAPLPPSGIDWQWCCLHSHFYLVLVLCF